MQNKHAQSSTAPYPSADPNYPIKSPLFRPTRAHFHLDGEEAAAAEAAAGRPGRARALGREHGAGRGRGRRGCRGGVRAAQARGRARRGRGQERRARGAAAHARAAQLSGPGEERRAAGEGGGAGGVHAADLRVGEGQARGGQLHERALRRGVGRGLRAGQAPPGHPVGGRICVGGERALAAKTWEELVLQPELNAVFGEDALLDVQRLNAQRFERDGLFAVTYHPLAMHVDRRLAADVNYFENEHADLTPHDLVILGGTFDHLHNGHKKLLSLAVSICARRILIGVTADSMLKKKSHAGLVEPLARRMDAVRAYLTFLNPQLIVDIVTIEDPFGPAIVIPEPAAMVVSTETLPGAAKINSIRMERGLPKLHIFACRRTESSTLSSSSIRAKIAASRSC
ncbi:unnamed protein product [Phytophthora fragariaefolia]|uniref:Unnamed protein product n=1 Tax=Phytophthora fragariaefolia TaxID=1490495 RepID=A0A9W7CWA5_9STRA|nr:unnamed protein product [Phytophthora fragariaefolia]